MIKRDYQSMNIKSYNIKNLNDIAEVIDIPTNCFIDIEHEIATVTTFDNKKELTSQPQYKNHLNVYIDGKLKYFK